MVDNSNRDSAEATAEQLALLRELGVSDSDLEDMGYEQAEEWIAELRAMRENTGKA